MNTISTTSAQNVFTNTEEFSLDGIDNQSFIF